eukprot:2466816-Amphidinium_carterae.1
MVLARLSLADKEIYNKCARSFGALALSSQDELHGGSAAQRSLTPIQDPVAPGHGTDTSLFATPPTAVTPLDPETTRDPAPSRSTMDLHGA